MRITCEACKCDPLIWGHLLPTKLGIVAGDRDITARNRLCYNIMNAKKQ